MRTAAFAFVFVLGLLFAPGHAFAFAPPPLEGHVVDTAGKLDANDIAYLDHRLEEVRTRTGYEIVAFIPGSLEGENIEDVAYKTFNAWGVGRKGLDNGVLLVIAPKERRVRIETGKGVGDKITDLQSSDIIEHTVSPLLQQGRYRDAVDQGTQAIAADLGGGAPANDGAQPLPASTLWKIGLFVIAAILILALAVISPTFRQMLFFALAFGGRSWFGGGGRDDGSGYRGGGGRSGGGGASGGF